MPDQPRPIPATPEALNKTLSRRPVLWVGAGASIAAGHPTTAALVAALIADTDDPIDPNLPFEQVADAFVAAQGPGALEDLLQRLVGASRPLTDLHHALARQAAGGAFAAIVTTNYDDLLERALAEAEVRFVFQSLEDNAVVDDPEAEVRLLKLHGSRDDWRHAVLSGRAYATFGRRYPFLDKQLDVVLRRHPVLFVGCSLRDPRIVDWLAALDDADAEGLKPWRALMTRRAWDEALAASEALRRGHLRPLVLADHDQLSRLWTEVTPPRIEPQRLALRLEVGASGVSARLDDGGEPWEPENLFADADFIAAVDELRKLGSRFLPTDEHGVLAPAAAGVAALLRERAATVGERLSSALLCEAARMRLRAAVHAGSAGRPALLRLRVAVDDGDAELVRQADRWLALPWELVRIDGRFPVEDHTLDLVREAVVDELRGLDEPERPLAIVATVAAPVDGVELDHEGEMYRLWRALGAGGEERLKVTDLGTLDELVEAVAEHHPSVVHFTGHGRPGELIFEDDAACSRAVGVDALVSRLRDAGPLPRLIYLSACHGTIAGDEVSHRSPGTGVREKDAEGERMVDRAAVKATVPSTAASLHRGGFVQVVAYFGPVGDAQATRTAAAFYTALAAGATARAALRRARTTAVEPLCESDGRCSAVYPLGWAQLVLYHRGDDRPTARAAPPASALAPRPDAPLRRIFDRLDRKGGSVRVEGIEGVQQLQFGFIGRRQPRGDAVRRWRHEGQRVLVVEGLGGLGKTALAAELLRLLAGGCRVLALDGRWAGAQPQPLAALWQEVQAARDDEAWSAQLAALQQEGLTGAGLAAAIAALAVREGGLVVYLDDAESLQHEPREGELGRWRDAELRALWAALVKQAAAEGSFGLLASSRYRPEGTPEEAILPLAPMSRWEMVRLMTWMPTLRRLPQADRAWLADRVAGHPRTIEYLEVLAREAEKALMPAGRRLEGAWREKVLEPIGAQAGARIEADLLLPRVWQALDANAREHLGRCTVLSAPAPWEAIRELEPVAGTGLTLIDAGLLSPFQAAGEPWWAPHRLVCETVIGLWEGDAGSAHQRIGRWFQAELEKNRGNMLLAQRAVEHLCAAGDGDGAWPTAEALIIRLRAAGRYREALAWVERVLDAQPTGAQRGMALMYDVQLLRSSGSLMTEGEAKLQEALTLVGKKERGDVLHDLGVFCSALGRLRDAASYLEQAIEAHAESFGEMSEVVAICLHSLAGVLQAQGDLVGAREKLERSLAISASVFGTEEHPDVAASLHELAGVLQAQGDLVGAREKLERSLAIQASVFGTAEHPDVAASLHELARVLQAQGDLVGAREKLERSLAISASVFGTEEHPSVAASLHSLAGVLQAQGDLVGAREKLERSLAIKASVFGTEEHPDVAASLHELARVLQAQGDLVGAREKLERSLAIQASVFGTEEHPSVAASLHSLARVLQAQGDLVGAREKLERVLRIEEKVYGTREHYSTAMTEVNLGFLLLELEEAESGATLLAHAYGVFLSQLGPDHPYTRQLAPLFTQKDERGEPSF